MQKTPSKSNLEAFFCRFALKMPSNMKMEVCYTVNLDIVEVLKMSTRHKELIRRMVELNRARKNIDLITLTTLLHIFHPEWVIFISIIPW